MKQNFSQISPPSLGHSRMACIFGPKPLPMSDLLIRNIKFLAQVEEEPRPFVAGPDMSRLPTLENAFVLVRAGKIADFGPMDDCPPGEGIRTVDADGRAVLPCWCDSHTHLVFAASRESEFVDRIRGLSYEEIARRGGGILQSARRLRDATEEELTEQARQRLQEVRSYGTGAIEIKSGYGLSVEGELKMLRVIRRLRESSELTIKATFLGAHALPPEYRDDRKAYLDLIIQEMLPVIAAEQLADYIDAFCEKGFFSVAETERLIEAGAAYGLKAKIHVNQFNSLGGVAAFVKKGAVSVDHLEVMSREDIQALTGSRTMPTLLPSCPFFLNHDYPPARRLIDAGLPVALATDYNPGSTPSGRMPFVLSLACIKMRMTPAEAINAATLNGARAMEIEATHGSIARGKVANLFITTPVPSLDYLPYAFGSDLTEKVILRGQW